jgi:hypothetical protein
MGEAVDRGSDRKFERRTRFGWLKFSNRRSRIRKVERAPGKVVVRVANARMAAGKVGGVVTTGVRIAVIAAATVDASKVRPKSTSTS